MKKRFRKEFQIKLREAVVSPVDEDNADLMKKALRQVEKSISDFKLDKFKKKSWTRQGDRYDSANDFFKKHRISLATEYNSVKNRTKLKCKLHNFVPELLYTQPNKSRCWPRPDSNKVSGRRFKLEQDVHFNNCKYCCTGYMWFKGPLRFQRAGDLLEFYPNLEELDGFDKKMQLRRVKEWDEVIFDDLKMKAGKLELGGALVTRRYRSNRELDESEFSFKLRSKKITNNFDPMEPAACWKRKGLLVLQEVYDELFRSFAYDANSNPGGIFIKDPGIFYFTEPVSGHCGKLCR